MKYSKNSLSKLKTAHPLIAQVFINVLNYDIMDITIICGARTRQEQDRFYHKGRSKVQWPNSKHNITEERPLSLAIDAAPYINGKLSDNFNHCCYLAGLVMGEAKRMGLTLRFGGDWDMDGEVVTDQTFNDLYHYEILI